MPSYPLSALALASLLLGFVAQAQEVVRAGSSRALPGQVIVDPGNASWLVYNKDTDGNGKLDPFYLGGPGGPEDFLYRGTRNANGTRTGDQQTIIDAIQGTGANCIYLMAVRTHGGDSKNDKTHNPFVESDPARGLDEAILNQWDEWFTLMDRHGIVIYFFFYDDDARVWDTGDTVGVAERNFLRGLVDKFEHHKHLIWCIAEEYAEAYGKTPNRIKNIAAEIRAADDHAHVIAVHHMGGDSTMDFPDDPNIDQFAQQAKSTSPEQLHADVLTAFKDAAGRFNVNMSENWNDRKDDHASDLVHGRRDRARQRNWACGMAGASFMVVGSWESEVGAPPPTEWLQDWGRQVRFFEATNYSEMLPLDELRFGGTQYVLAKPGDSYIAYADRPANKLGIKGLPAGRYALTWLDCQTGRTVTNEVKVEQPGDHAFDKPRQIGAECAAWIRRATDETVVIEDSLQGTTHGRQVGGAIGPEGYSPGLGPNHVLYELPRTVREGYVEFEVKGMDAAAVPKDGDHGFLGMYDGRGVAEPAAYFKDFKSNFYRWNVHWRQNRSALKAVISCAAPGAEREQAAHAQFGEKRDWSHEPTGETVKWDPAKWHRLRVEWRDKTFRVLVDGEEKWRAAGPHDYAPVQHRIWLGSAPAKEKKYPCLVKDIVYRNFKVVAFSQTEAKPALKEPAEENIAGPNPLAKADPPADIVPIGKGGADGVVAAGKDGVLHVVYGGKYRYGAAPDRLSTEESITELQPVSTVRMTIDAAAQPHVVFTTGVTQKATRSYYTARIKGRWLPAEKFADAADFPERKRAYVADVATDGQGHVLVSFWVSRPIEKRWEYDDPSFYYRWRSPDGKWGPPLTLSAHWSSAPKVEYEPERGFFLLWQSRANRWRIAGPIAAGEKFTEAQSISTGSEALVGASGSQNEGADFSRTAGGSFVVAGNVREKFEGPVGVWAALGQRDTIQSTTFLGSFPGTKRGDESSVHPVPVIDAATGDAFIAVMNPDDKRAWYTVHRNGNGNGWLPYARILPVDTAAPQGNTRQGPSVADVPGPGVVALARDGAEQWHLCTLVPPAAAAQSTKVSSASPSAMADSEIYFKKQVLTTRYFCDGMATGDFNRDGHADIVAGPFIYQGPEFKRTQEFYPAKEFPTESVPTDSMFSYVHDFSGDGWPDILVLGRVLYHQACWYENPRGASGHWQRHFAFERVFGESPPFLDVDGDGRPELVSHWQNRWGFIQPNWNEPAREWTFKRVTAEGKFHHFYHGTGIGDVNGDGRLDLLLNEGWYEQPADKSGEWSRHDFKFAEKGGAQMFAYDVDGDGDNDIITAIDAHGWGLAWFEQFKEGGEIGFQKHVIMGSRDEEAQYGVAFSQPHALTLADMDGDGLLDIVTGKRRWAHGPKGDIEPMAEAVLYWFQLIRERGQPRFVPRLVDRESGVGVQIAAVDVNGDGRPDILSSSKLGAFVFLSSKPKQP